MKLSCSNLPKIFSALWDFVFTFNQKQNWFRYHHVMGIDDGKQIF